MKNILTTVCFLSCALSALTQTKPIKVVFDVTSGDTLTHQAVLRHVSVIAKAYPQSTVEVVIYGGALPMALKSKSTVAKGIQKLESPNVSFKVCRETMKRYGVDSTQLLPSLGTVPHGIIEVVTRQAEGWAYIKEAHH